MDIEYAFVADAAQVIDGKVYVWGGNINTIWATNFPTIYPSLALVVAFKVHAAEYDRRQEIEVELWDSDGKRLSVVQAGLTVGPPPDDQVRDSVVPLVVSFREQRFPQPGAYAFYVLVHGEQRKSVTLYMASGTSPSQLSAP